MAMLVIDSDTSAVLPFGNTLLQVNCGVGSPAAVQLRTAGPGERTFTSVGLPSRVTETIKQEKNKQHHTSPSLSNCIVGIANM